MYHLEPSFNSQPMGAKNDICYPKTVAICFDRIGRTSAHPQIKAVQMDKITPIDGSLCFYFRLILSFSVNATYLA
jgi:hypothetical protein